MKTTKPGAPAFTFEIRPVILLVMLVGTFVAGYMTSCNSHIGKSSKGENAAPAVVPAPVAPPASVPVQLEPSGVQSSGWMNRPPNGIQHHTYAFDGNFGTSWSPGRGEGQWVEATYASNVRVTEIVVATGIVGGCGTQDSPSFRKSPRLKTFRIVLSDGTEIKASAGIDERCVIVQVPDKATKSVKLVVDSVWPGTKSNELGLSEIKIMGTQLQ